MKLLGISLIGHDHSAAYFDGKKVRYHKFERNRQIKRYRFTDYCDFEKDLKNIFNVSIDEMDDIITCNSPFTSGFFPNNWNLNTISHHYAHALSVYGVIGRKPDISFVIDGVGDGKTWSVIKNDKWRCINYGTLKQGSIGWGIKDSGNILNIKCEHVNDIAGKVMGLQSYGIIDDQYLNIIRKYNMNNINDIFSYDNWINYKGDKLVSELTKINWSKTIHFRIEELLVEFFSEFASPDDVIGYSGGVAQNVVWNTALKKRFKNLYIAPHSCDEGLSLGCLEWLRQKHNLPVFDMSMFPYMQSDVSPSDTPTDETISLIAKKLAEGQTVAWYQGHGEIGPRALGNRSILMDPRIPNGKEIINRIKNRENYRPFGASVLVEYVKDYFDMEWEDEYMLFTCRLKSDILPSITHIDGTCRVQTVGDKNPIFRKLLEEFYKLTGCPVLLNTSLNLAGKPIAGYPENAIELLRTTSLDCAVVGNHIYLKNGE
jgi:carbamoyltransferase